MTAPKDNSAESAAGCGADILAQAEEILRNDAHLQCYQIRCAFQHGTLVLRGSVQCYYHKQMAQARLAELDGVLLLVNQIEVEGCP